MTQESQTHDLTTHSLPEITGRITSAFLSKKRLTIEGKWISEKTVPVEAFKVTFQEQEFYVKPLPESKFPDFILQISLNPDDPCHLKKRKNHLKEPYSQKILMWMRQGFAHFLPNLFAKFYRQAIKKQNALLKVTPLLKDETEGTSFYGLANLLLPLPTEKENRQIGGGNLVEISSEFLSLMAEQAGLKKTDHVLDVGCGLGRMAYALAHYLEPSARYEGFDIMRSLIKKAQKLISPHFPNFHFQHVNVWNSFYNPQGTENSSSFRFPFDDQTFHFVLLTSVFSHMLTPDIRHYLSEIYRVLQPGGRCLFSCFLMTEEAKKLIHEKKSTQELIHRLGDNCYIVSPEYPEASIGYEKSALLDLVKQAGFEVLKICDGSWCGRKNYTSYQDIVIISKAS